MHLGGAAPWLAFGSDRLLVRRLSLYILDQLLCAVLNHFRTSKKSQTTLKTKPKPYVG